MGRQVEGLSLYQRGVTGPLPLTESGGNGSEFFFKSPKSALRTDYPEMNTPA